ncbi:MAG: TonB-dependent receptor [Caulobacteraceae bacterium]|nr:MAG: TonB-dependent receptor [Caulobacteraceae bacterium]
MRFTTLLAAGVAASALLSGTAALAQDAAVASVDGTDVGEVIVTARKREENLKDVPIAVTAVGADTLEREQIYVLKDIAAFSPGLTINSDAVGRAFVSIRGVGTTLIDSVQPGVGIFIDGIYQSNTSYLNSPLLDVARIEVLRGPQGTLFGNNTLGGAISVVTRQPSDEYRLRLSGAIAGPDDFGSLAGSLSGPIIEGRLQGRIAASYHTQDGFSENALAGGNANPLEQTSVNGALRWELSDSAVITTSAYYDKVTGGQTPYANVTGVNDHSRDTTLNLNSIATYEYRGLNVKGVFDIGNTKLTAIGAYDRKEGKASGDGDFGPIDFFRIYNGHNDADSYTAELRADTEWTGNFSTLVGVFANDAETTNGNDTLIVPLGFTQTSVATQHIKQQAIFGTAFWTVDDSLEITGGLRYDHQEVTATNATSDYATYQLQPRLTITKHWTDEVMTYASVSRGFRGGGSNGDGAPNAIYRGDSVWTYEIGTKLQTADRRLSVDAAVFYNDYKDYIGQNSLAPRVGGAGFVAINLNSGDVKSYGLEVEARWRPTDNLSFNAGVTLLHARIEDDSAYFETTGMNLASDRLLFVPDWNYFASGSYTLPLGADDLRFDLTVIGKGDRIGSTLNDADVPVLESYTLVNSSLTFVHGEVNVALFATNLFDEDYTESYLDRSLLEKAGLAFLATNLAIQGDGRRVGIRASVNF